MPRRNYSIDFAEIRKFDKEPAHFYWHVLERVNYLGWPYRDAPLRKALARAPEGVRLFWLSQLIEGPVENGGFGQYFGCKRPLWVHEAAKRAILEFGCPGVVKVVEEAERYVHRNRSKLGDGMPAAEWAAIMGPVALKRAARDINNRFMRALSKLHDAREKYLQEHPERFTNG
jgi:hypothetical protein